MILINFETFSGMKEHQRKEHKKFQTSRLQREEKEARRMAGKEEQKKKMCEKVKKEMENV